MRRLSPFAIALAALLALGACEGKGTTATSDVDVEEIDVPTPEEARAEAEQTIDASNADEVFEQLQAEIENDLNDG